MILFPYELAVFYMGHDASSVMDMFDMIEKQNVFILSFMSFRIPTLTL